MHRVCRICGQREEDHHEPDWIEVPDGCVCDPLEWDGNVIPPPCDCYQGDGTKNCTKCEHDKACHKK